MKSKALAIWSIVALFTVTLILMHKLNTLQKEYWDLDAEHQALIEESGAREEKIVRFFMSIQHAFNYWKENVDEQE